LYKILAPFAYSFFSLQVPLHTYAGIVMYNFLPILNFPMRSIIWAFQRTIRKSITTQIFPGRFIILRMRSVMLLLIIYFPIYNLTHVKFCAEFSFLSDLLVELFQGIDSLPSLERTIAVSVILSFSWVWRILYKIRKLRQIWTPIFRLLSKFYMRKVDLNLSSKIHTVSRMQVHCAEKSPAIRNSRSYSLC